MWKAFLGLKVSAKILTITIIIIGVIVTINFRMFISNYRTDIGVALEEKAASFTAVADEAKNHVSKLWADDDMRVEELVEEVTEMMNQGKDYRDSRIFQTIPVVAGWRSAQEAAEREGLGFEIISYDARNPKHDPASDNEHGKFRGEMLTKLKSQVKKNGDPFVSGINEKNNSLHYMRAIKLDESCLMCHGDPNTSPNGDGTDILGFEMENWEVGRMHGAFEVIMPLDPIQAQVAGFTKKALLITVLISIVGFVLFIALISKTVTKPLTEMSNTAESMADGDFQTDVEYDSTDEIGGLANAFRSMMDKQRELLTEVRGTPGTLVSSSDSLSNVSSQMSSGAEEMSTQANNVAASVEQMSANVQTVANTSGDITTNISTVAASAEETSSIVQNVAVMTEEMSATVKTIAQNAINNSEELANLVDTIQSNAKNITSVAGSVEEMTVSITEVAKNTEQASQIAKEADTMSGDAGNLINELSNVVEEVAKMADTIKDIADQTNMLALNATIEAAGAGEAGKGFAVVANEVKELARGSAEAASDIREQIDSMLNNTSEVVKSIDGISKIIREVREISENISSSINEQSTTVTEVSSTLASISTTTENVSDVSSKVSSAIAEIANSANEAAVTSEDVARDVNQTSTTVNEIAKSIEGAASGVKEVSQNINEVSVGIGEISSNIQGIDSASKEIVVGSNGTHSSAQELSKKAVDLKDIVNKFKI